MVHKAIDRVACGWEICIALLTRQSLEITTKFFDNSLQENKGFKYSVLACMC